MVLGSKSLKKAKERIRDSMAQTVTLKLVHGRDVYETTLPCFSTFGQLKEYVYSVTGVPLKDIKLNFKGRDKSDHDTLAAAGVKQGARIFVGESAEYKASIAAQKEAAELDALQKEQQALLGRQGIPLQATPAAVPAQPIQSPQPHSQASRPHSQPFHPPAHQSHDFANWPAPDASAATPPVQQAAVSDSEAQQSVAAISAVSRQVDELEQRVQSLPAGPESSKEAVKLAEVLTQKLLALDGLVVTQETRQLRKSQINRINSLCDQLEIIKSRPPAGGTNWTQF